MNYIYSNKEAWEEAFDNRIKGWYEDIDIKLQNEAYPFLEKELIEELHNYDFTNKIIGQFCCNNGRELLSLMKFGAKEGIGFDIAENMVTWANNVAQKVNSSCLFVATNILEIDDKYSQRFDFIFITVGAMTWFQDLNLFFNKVSQCLKPGGMLIINDMHPISNMFSIEGEANFDKSEPAKLLNSYFKQDPWIENSGMGYMNEIPYNSKSFYSYSHTFASIVNALSSNKIIILKLQEFQHDISTCFKNLSNNGIPLSYILTAKKID